MGELPTWQAQEYTCSYDELGFSCCLSLKHWRLFPALGDYFQGKSAFSVAIYLKKKPIAGYLNKNLMQEVNVSLTIPHA